MKRRSSSVLTGALLAGAMVVALPCRACATRPWGVPNVTARCGTGWTVTGAPDITDFASTEALRAHGTVMGACRAPGDTTTTSVNTTFDVAATVLDASCDSITLALANIYDGKDVTIDMRDEVVP